MPKSTFLYFVFQNENLVNNYLGKTKKQQFFHSIVNKNKKIRIFTYQLNFRIKKIVNKIKNNNHTHTHTQQSMSENKKPKFLFK